MRSESRELPDGRAVVPIASLLPADSPRVDGEDVAHVRDLAELDHEIPPIVVHRPSMRVVDGMHRLRAAISRGQSTVEVCFLDGDERDLFVIALELNARNGLPLSQQDRTAAAARVVVSHAHWSDRRIAELAGLSAKTVAAIRRRSTEDVPRLNGRVGRDGKIRPLSVVRNRRLAGALMAERPDAGLREIARAAGVSVGTAHDVRRRLQSGVDLVPPGAAQADPDSAATRVVPVWEPVATTALLARLRNDPSLRLSATGRALLRLLEAHAIPAATWTALADGVPAHCAQAVVDLAHRCADSWTRFAQQVEKREIPPEHA